MCTQLTSKQNPRRRGNPEIEDTHSREEGGEHTLGDPGYLRMKHIVSVEGICGTESLAGIEGREWIGRTVSVWSENARRVDSGRSE